MKLITNKENVITDYHGVKVSDPYRWLEDMNSPEVIEWVNNQNDQTHQYFGNLDGRKKVKKEITELMNYEKYTVPQKEGDYYYFHKNDGLQNQPIFYRSPSLDLTDLEVIIDPNALSEEGTTAITNTAFSQDHSLLAYAISYNGSDWQEIRIKNLETKEDLPEILYWCKFTNIAWKKDNSGFYYSRYPDPNTVPEEETSFNNCIYWHNIGTSQEDDELIHQDKEHKEFSFSPTISDDNQYLIIKVYNGTEPKSRVYYRPLDRKDSFIPLINDGEYNYDFIGNKGNTFYIHTNYSAPKGKIVAININHPEKEDWKDIIVESEDTITFIRMINNQFVVAYLHNAYNVVKIFNLEGSFIKELDLPKFITITDIKGEKNDSNILISYTSYLYPARIANYNFQEESLKVIVETGETSNTNQFETKQVYYKSKDGTKIPMFITHKKGLELTGNHPVLLYGYGGYNISMTPTFSPANMMWMQNGGIYAVANLRGGGEFGEEWHLAGILVKKQNVFDDFITAAEWLIDEGYTNNRKLAIMGGSNGGLLVGTCINQRPDLFGAALCLVPVTDILRFHLFTVGRFWTTEFGNAEENKEQFEYMYKYSPLHNVRSGEEYPPTLITTADSDDRVVPLHAMKFTATLQEAQKGDNPILLRVEKNAGHGLGKPTAKIIEEQTDLYSFLFKELHVETL